ncbi:carbon-nitrogen hydrolase family protein [Neisseria musculi]|uniref:Carbon-nitrogen hydrolase family protein n=2 Tax=Neisseria musculi TaxID=1815583 RepID=A0A7H1MDM5_9NEIS|nr:carbon-nitrogen hydrolase family protein [Neisseria musculi]QNT59740.1 carbon-nitrogen hydrolase family protein [Neisseria musculi]
MHTLRAAAVQMVSGTRPEENIRTMQRLVEKAADAGADWVVLPEYWPLMGAGDADKLAVAEPLGNGVFQTALSETAKQNRVVLFGGTVPLQSPDPDKVFNTLPVYGRNGECIGIYHKMHLFGYSGLGERYAEADTISAGAGVPHFSADGINVAAGVCYDLRFPEFFRAQLPFEVMVLPAAFTYTTGKAHWELLLRARAVENQCYVIASAQGGTHENGRRTFGHSMIIDPWGGILDVLPEGEGMVTAEIDARRLQSVRTRLPALAHRRL